MAVLVQTLVAFGSMIGRTAYTLAEDDRHYCNEFAVLVGTTAKGRKGLSWGRVKRLVREVDPGWLDERIAGGLSSAEGLILALGGTDPDADKRLLIHEPEFASVLRQIERLGNNLSTTLRQAWDGGRLRTMTKNSPLDAKDTHVSLIGHGTESELRKLLTNTEAANGFANRILWVCVRRSRLLPDGGHLDPQVLKDLQWRLLEAVNYAKDVELVKRTTAARNLWHKVYGPLSEGRPGLAGSLTARAAPRRPSGDDLRLAGREVPDRRAAPGSRPGAVGVLRGVGEVRLGRLAGRPRGRRHLDRAAVEPVGAGA